MPSINKIYKFSVAWIVSELVLLMASASVGRAQGVGPATPPPPVVLAERHHTDHFSIARSYAGAPEQGVQSVAPASLMALGDWSVLVFASTRNRTDYEIYRATGAGANQTQLTFDPNYDFAPNLTRGGGRVAFQTDRHGETLELYAVNTDGAGLARLTNNDANDYWPVWSPDNLRIAFYSYRDGDRATPEIYVMQADGSNQTRLTYNNDVDRYPSWSPDGNRIVYASNLGGVPQIWVMNADGSGARSVTVCNQYCYRPTWSPDGTRIMFVDDGSGDGFDDIAVVNLDGSGRTYLALSFTQTDLTLPTWAPDGQNIVFTQVHWVIIDGEFSWDAANLYGMNVNSRQIYSLVSTNLDWFPDWETMDVAPPTSQVTPLPTFVGTTFNVQWSGTDNASGIAVYDVQYRDGAAGAWTDWQINTTQTTTQFVGQNGHIYFFRARARDVALNQEGYLDGNGDTQVVVDSFPPTSSVAALNTPATEPVFTVSWSGNDNASGLKSYDVQYRDGLTGTWRIWLSNTQLTSAQVVGQIGHTYYFRSLATDHAGNLEVKSSNTSDTSIAMPPAALTGRVLNNQDQPVAAVAAQTTAPALNGTRSNGQGNFSLYFGQAGVYSLTVARSGFGVLPPMRGISVSEKTQALTLYLPPVDDSLVEGNFESGALVAWNVLGEVSPTLTNTAHTGNSALQLGGPTPAPSVTPAAPFTLSAVLTQTSRVLTAPFVSAQLNASTVTTTTTFTLTNVAALTPTVVGQQELGRNFTLRGVLSGNLPLTATLTPVTLTLTYSETTWQAAQVPAETSLRLWHFNSVAAQWQPLTGTLNTLSNTLLVTTTQLGSFALLGEANTTPRVSSIAQTFIPTGTLTRTLSLLYRVANATVSDTLTVIVASPNTTVTYTLPLTATTWTHHWREISTSLTTTVQFQLAQPQRNSSTRVVLDEVSFGTPALNIHRVFLPNIYVFNPTPTVLNLSLVIPDLIAYWPGEGDAQDLAGTNLGALVNGVAFVPGKVGQAFDFDGVNDSVRIPKSDTLNFRDQDYSLAVWVKFTEDFSGDIQTRGGLFIYHDYASLNYHALFIDPGDETAIFSFRDGNRNEVWVTSTTSLNDGQWHLLVGERTSTTTGRIYIDGRLEGSVTVPGIGVVDTTLCPYVRLGSTNTSNCDDLNPAPGEQQHLFKGQIDEMRVYAHALTLCEIQTLAGKPCTAPEH